LLAPLLLLTNDVMMMMKCYVAEWLLKAYRTQWLAMLQVDNGTDLGCVGGCLSSCLFHNILLLAVFGLLHIATSP